MRCRPGAAVLLAAWVPSAAVADDVLVWFGDASPSDEALRKGERVAGPVAHLTALDLAWPAPSGTVEDDVRIAALRAAVADARARWLDFEVEYGIASGLEELLGAVGAVRDDADRDAVLVARLVQGAAVYRSFHPDDFASDPRAEPFRASWAGGMVNRPWAEACALLGDRPVVREDLGDGSSLPAFVAVMEALRTLEGANVLLPDPYPGSGWVLDGRPVSAGAQDVAAGEHYLHADAGGALRGRQRLVVEPGTTVEVVLPIGPPDLDTTRDRILDGTTTGIPDAVAGALEAAGERHGGAVFVGAVAEKRIVVLPYARGAELAAARLLTFLGYGEAGLGVLASRLFDGDSAAGPGVQLGGGVELGVSYALLAAGFDLAITPGNTITHGNADLTDNVTTSVFPQPWLGAGGYALRPDAHDPTLAFVGTVGWNAPAHMAYGGRVIVGLPVGERRSWLRLTAGANGASGSMWDEVLESGRVPMYNVFVRAGTGAAL